ncbi:MAG TPA: FHA domain-containing protein [Haliangiales bacterium]|nr:FHA domain-containing protein [Haliangiales bacterium]
MHKLIIQDDEGKTTVVPLIRDEITIGRKEGNTIRLTERNVSRRHARILKANGSVFVEDLDSYNGVKVNGQRIQGRVPVTEQDRIQIGDYLLELRVDRGAQDAFSVSSVTQTAPMEVVSLSDLQSIPPGPPPIPSTNGSGQPTAMRPGYGAPMSETPSQPTAPMPVPETPARLVVVSQNFAGREFVLDKPAMVIGRTDDNDVVINHRSISRHHAKIVQEQGRYAVVDLQSANGVRVNGEEYGKVELRRGDVIDLGHVRMRYVEPGEDFVFERDGHAIGVAVKPARKKGGGRGVLVGALALAVVGGVGGVIVATRGGGAATATADNPPVSPTADPRAAKTTDSPTKAAATAPAEAKKPEEQKPAPPPQEEQKPAEVKKAPREEEPPKPPAAPDSAKVLEDAKQALGEERWLSALAAAEQVLKTDPQNADAKKIQDTANAEYRNQTTFEKFGMQKDAGKIAEAAKLYAELPEGSYYRDKGKQAFDDMKEAFLKEREGEAKALKDKGQCDRIPGLARRSAEVFPEAKQRVDRAGAGCTLVAGREPTVKPDKGDRPAAETSDPDALVKEAEDAARQQSWPTALKKSNEVLKVRPDDVKALVVAVLASCRLGDKGKALKYYGKITDAKRKNMVKQLCTQVSIILDEGDQ